MFACFVQLKEARYAQMAKHNLTEKQVEDIEYIEIGYFDDRLSGPSAMRLLKSIGLTSLQQITQFEIMAFKKGVIKGVPENA